MGRLHRLTSVLLGSSRRARAVEIALLAPAAGLALASLVQWTDHLQLRARLQVAADLAAAGAAAAAPDEGVATRVARAVVARELRRASLPVEAVAVALEPGRGRVTVHLAYEPPRRRTRVLFGLMLTPPAAVLSTAAAEVPQP